MRSVEIAKDVYWVGAVDWDLRDFHGYSMARKGTTYNAFLVMDEKTTLFDTVADKHREEFFKNIHEHFYCRLGKYKISKQLYLPKLSTS